MRTNLKLFVKKINNLKLNLRTIMNVLDEYNWSLRINSLLKFYKEVSSNKEAYKNLNIFF